MRFSFIYIKKKQFNWSKNSMKPICQENRVTVQLTAPLISAGNKFVNLILYWTLCAIEKISPKFFGTNWLFLMQSNR